MVCLMIMATIDDCTNNFNNPNRNKASRCRLKETKERVRRRNNEK